jgi:nicotinamide-nucleotide amidase
MAIDAALAATAAALLDAYRTAGLRIVTAESCTGGLVAGALTDIAGSSDVVECGFIAYSNAAKTQMLDVAPGLIQGHGAVSAQVATAMAAGALAHSAADVAVAVTGIAGPGGGTPAKPVGLVYIAAQRRGRPPAVERHHFSGDRHAVRIAAVAAALDLLQRQL